MRKLKVGSVVGGFILKQEDFIEDIDSKIFMYEHIKTGAKFVHIKNKEENKAFSIGFKTIPTDDTGVLHILEHTVLGGSKKYPVKEPVIELEKGSVNTFINAFTFEDKTVYPVASKNNKDLFNLIKVYLDGVYNPNVLENEKIFRQEGWHYHLENLGSDVEYSGVVYNEMRGIAFTPISILFEGIKKSLYPDTHYRYSVGGQPYSIVDLDYNKFIDTYNKFYHPSNSYMCLYGDIDAEEILRYINDEYLNFYDKSDCYEDIKKQLDLSNISNLDLKCPVTGESEENFMSINYSVGNFSDMELCVAMDVLAFMLAGSEESPLKNAILNKNLADDVFVVFNADMIQPYFSIIVKGFDGKNKELILDIIDAKLKEIYKNGLNLDLIKGSLNLYEFKCLEDESSENPKAVDYSIDVISAMIYDCDLTEGFKLKKYLKNIKEKSKSRFFEELIDDCILNNPHKTIVCLNSDENYISDYVESVAEKLNNKIKTLNSEDLNNLYQDTLELIKYQSEPELIENLKKMPSLTLDDIDKKEKNLPVLSTNIDDVEFLHYDIFTKDIMYLTFMFDMKVLTEDELVYVPLMNLLLSRMGTNVKNYANFSNEKMMNLGGMVFNTRTYFDVNSDRYNPYLECFIKVMPENYKKAIDILYQNIMEISFDDSKRIEEIVNEEISNREMNITMDGYSLALNRLQSYYSEYGKYLESIDGIHYLNFLKGIDFKDSRFVEKLKDKLYDIKRKVFNYNYLKVSFIGDKKSFELVKDSSIEIKRCLYCTDLRNNNAYRFSSVDINEGMYISSDVNYVAKGYNFKLDGFNYSGGMSVLENIVERDYLWKNIRVKGGAYGIFMNIDEFCNFYICSYRDPNLKTSLSVYDKIPDYVENLDIEESELEKVIISTLNRRELPDFPLYLGKRAINLYLSGRNLGYRQKIRDEVLSTTVEDLRSYSRILKLCIDKNYYTVSGGKDVIKNESIFNSIVKMI